MANEDKKIKRIHDLKSNLESTSRIIDGQWAFATDTEEVIIRRGSVFHSIGNNEAWERSGTVLNLISGLDYVRMTNCDKLYFKTASTKSWTSDYTFVEFGGTDDSYKVGFYQEKVTDVCGMSSNGSYFDD